VRETASATPSGGKAAPDGSTGRPGIDWRWEHVIVVFDRNGKMIEDWSQWDSIWGRPHDIEVSPYDPEKHLWIVDADNHFVSEFTHDGKQRLLTLGTPGIPGDDDTHFRRPTFMAFMDDNTWYLADGYDNTRVIKYDMHGKKLLQWGLKGNPPHETRPGYFNNVHGIAVDPGVFTSTTVPTGACKCLTRTASFSTSGPSVRAPRSTFTASTWGPITFSGRRTRGPISFSPTIPGATSSIRGEPMAPARAACGVCTASPPTRKAIYILPRCGPAAFRSMRHAKAPTRRFW